MDEKTRDFAITTTRSRNWNDEEVKRRLGRVYSIILNQLEQKETADGGDFGELAPTAAGDSPSVRLEESDGV
jgi:hypothetical protein